MKIIQNQIKFATSIVLCFFVFSCTHKDKSEITPPKTDTGILGIMENYFKVANTKVDGTFIFESNLCNNDSTLTDIVQAGGVFYNSDGNVQSNNGAISIGNMSLNNHNGTFYIDKAGSQKGLYGTDVTFTIQSSPALSNTSKNASSATAKSLTTATVYSPLPISITNIPPRTPITLTQNTSTTLTWPAD